MKRLISLTLIYLSAICLFASPCLFIQGDAITSYTTNVFSNPLPVNTDSDAWLQNKIDNPFLKRFDLGADIAVSFYSSEDVRTGLSGRLQIGVPVKATQIKPSSSDHSSDWNYISSESGSQALSLIGSFGPTFRGQLGNCDIGLAIRLALGSLNFADGSLMVGLQTEAFANYFFNSRIYLSAGLTYDAHIMRFINDMNKYYEDNFFMATFTPFVGIGIIIGDDKL